MLNKMANENKAIKLEATGIEFQAPDNYRFHDEGFVRSLQTSGNFLHKQYGKSIEGEEGYRPKEGAQGASLIFLGDKEDGVSAPMTLSSRSDEINHHIFYLKQEGKNGEGQTAFIRGYHEGDILTRLEKTQPLVKKLKELGVRMPYDFAGREESYQSFMINKGPEPIEHLNTKLIQNLSGLCAVLNNGLGEKQGKSHLEFGRGLRFLEFLSKNAPANLAESLLSNECC